MSSKYKALLVGAGAMGRAWGENLRDNPDVDFAGWIDVQPGVAAQAAADLGLRELYVGTDMDEALHKVVPDFVVDSSSIPVHHTVVKRALEFGVPVLGEKPMSDKWEQALEMVAASERAGKLYMVSQSRRYDRRLHAYRRLIEENLGKVGMIHADFFMDIYVGGYRLGLANPLLIDMAVHTLDAARFLCRCDAVSVYCDAFHPEWSRQPGNTNVTAIYEMANGARFTYRGCWVSVGYPTTWDSSWRAIGSNGSAMWDGDNGLGAEVLVANGGEVSREVERRSVDMDEDMPIGIDGALREFLDALETGKTPTGECHDNLNTMRMVFGAIKSAETGMRIELATL